MNQKVYERKKKKIFIKEISYIEYSVYLKIFKISHCGVIESKDFLLLKVYDTILRLYYVLYCFTNYKIYN